MSSILKHSLCFASLLVGACGDRPWFESVLLPADTTDTLGPYVAEAWVVADEGVFRFVGEVATVLDERPFSDVPQVEIPLELVQGDDAHGLWRLTLPGRPAGSVYAYRLKLIDDEGNIERSPEPGTYTLRIEDP